MFSLRIGQKKQNEHLSLFVQRWKSWRSYLDALVTEQGGILICPDSRTLITANQAGANGHPGSVKISLPSPICLYNIPKTLTSKIKGAGRLAIFIDGSYELEEDSRDHVRRMRSEVAFYEISNSSTAQLKLLDAYHFDFTEDKAQDTAPHPIFHVQRNFIMNHDIEARFKLTLDQVPSIKAYDFKHSNPDISKLFQYGKFRIPTPQLDILNLGAVIAADQLVGIANPKCYGFFKKLLESIHGTNSDHHHVKKPRLHNAVFYNHPRKVVADWYCSR